MKKFTDYRGVEIRLDGKVLHEHIIGDHVANVRYIQGILGESVDIAAILVDIIGDALLNPIGKPQPDPNRPNSLRYYGYIRSINKYVRVAVKFLPGEAWVSTAFITDEYV